MAAGNWNDYYDGLTIHPYCGDPGADQDKGAFYDSAMRPCGKCRYSES